jgi:hypothetical protein
MIDDAGCPFPVSTRASHAYMFVTDKVSWFAARDYCVQRGYHLVTIEDAVENVWVTSKGGGIWIGLNDLMSEARWVWENGSNGTWRNWNAATGEPNGGSALYPEDEDCAYLVSQGTWYDGPCSVLKSFICEAQLW